MNYGVVLFKGYSHLLLSAINSMGGKGFQSPIFYQNTNKSF